ncbi:putative ABC transport system ATP-binding protein [Parafrankia irregularis]|uniref:Putative ABC transport system ATP-binding protein n=1 Tax=Parafrankia irregularis TaxID=795642 RepID=A0A0S4QY36_9ACTN|nr:MULTISPECIES: ABC transporter ATP-binding protein [Parafrankia]MBE3203445.1 ABC transporter ATP-binding protein [Parafrankia sp. CH37]CUU60196.1 putative ABC transport system ATP-binding protein [Parafrankia irregularis]
MSDAPATPQAPQSSPISPISQVPPRPGLADARTGGARAGGDARTGDAAVLLRSVYKTFAADTAPVHALRGAGLTVAHGEFVAVMGPSGSGKSTLLNVVAGLEHVDDGSVTVAGMSLASRSEADLARLRRRHIGMVFQFFHLLETMTVADNVVLAARLSGVGRRAAVRRGHDLLDLLGLLERADSLPGTLSGGQRQRLAIARALANEPTVLLADEPTGALDSAGAAEVLDLFTRLHRRGQTILMVTHDHQVAAGAERIVTMRDGRVSERPGAGA